MNISYEESLRLKGIAILMMVWLHCFNNWNDSELTYSCFLYVGEEPLVFRTTYLATIVVPLYCFLSGYGLSKKYPYNLNYVGKKLRTLYSQYWLVLSAFMLIGFLMNLNNIDFSISFFLGNFLGYDTSYNTTLWFLLPYALLFVSSISLFPLLKRKYGWVGILVSFIAFLLASKVLKEQAIGVLEVNALVVVCLNYLKLSFPFLLGFFASQYTLPKKCQRKYRGLILTGLLLLMVVKLFIPSYSLSYIYLIPFVVLLHLVRYPSRINKFLCYFGRKSTFIWFIHAYFIYYLFSPYIYKISYCLAIFTVVLLCSLILAILFEKIDILLRCSFNQN